MKTKLIYLILMVAAVSFNACKKDEVQVPKLIPVVVSGAAVNVTLSSATLAGGITSDGNDKITSAGVVYSSNVGLPTVVDNKKESTDIEGDFTVAVDGLTSGTTYHVRAFATNSVGTGYGSVIDFTTGNAAPVASNVTITGTLEVTKTLTASYAYSDPENNPEGATAFQWFVATSAAGAGETAITGAIAKTFVIQDAQNGKFLRVSVTPKASVGTTDGVEVKSIYTTAIGAETVTFTYNGAAVTYGTIVSVTTQKKWLDRNLGASQVAQNVTDYKAYGDLFQWGRLADGHQQVTRTDGTDIGATGVTGVSATLSTSDVPSANAFIKASGGSYDWRATANNSLWQGVSGINNPCPSGWRVATQAEWTAEGITTVDDGYSKLKLTYTGWRDVTDGSFASTETRGYYWSSTVSQADPTLSVQIRFTPTVFSTLDNNRGNGYACRCIKN